ncbi:MAG: helix-turn-helix domain-containing protein [Candidatus Latescibacterota bacterium]
MERAVIVCPGDALRAADLLLEASSPGREGGPQGVTTGARPAPEPLAAEGVAAVGRVPHARPAAAGARPEPSELTSLEEHERRYIEHVLQQTGGVVKGPRGAARLLGMNESTLGSRMRKLGIRRG